MQEEKNIYKQKGNNIVSSLHVIISSLRLGEHIKVIDDIFNVTVTINRFHDSSIEYLARTKDIDTIILYTRLILELYTIIVDMFKNNDEFPYSTDTLAINLNYYSNVYKVFTNYKEQTTLDVSFSNLSI